LYYFGGQVRETQTSNGSWVNALYSIDLSETFSTGSPNLNLLNAGASPGNTQSEFNDSPPQVVSISDNGTEGRERGRGDLDR